MTCILRWASHRAAATCPQCKQPFEHLLTYRALDGTLHDFPMEESVTLLKRARWFTDYMLARTCPTALRRWHTCLVVPRAAAVRSVLAAARATVDFSRSPHLHRGIMPASPAATFALLLLTGSEDLYG